MRKLITRVLGAAAIIGMLLISPAAQVGASGEDELAAVRAATAQFHSITAAEAAGYHKALWCFEKPGVGGMGWHWLKPELIGTLTPTQPAALVYEPDGDKFNLVAVEYIVPWSAWVSFTPPQLYGRSFYRIDSLHLWALHAWIWRPNPLGMFANYNPSVKLCPGH